MRAAIITRPGGPEVLEVRDVARPEPGTGEVLVRIRASALNRADLLQREGRYPAPPGWPADIPGMEIAGEVAACGPATSLWKVGDRVFGIVGGGGNAQFIVTHERTLAAIPENLDWREAAAVPEAFITAHDALVTQAEVRPSERVLIHAVGSGVGLAAVQLARAAGALPLGDARTAAKIERARSLGLADGFVVDDIRALAQRVTERTNGAGVEIVLDLVGGENANRCPRREIGHTGERRSRPIGIRHAATLLRIAACGRHHRASPCPLRPGRPAMSRAGWSPVGGENGGHVEMAVSLISTRPLEVISNP